MERLGRYEILRRIAKGGMAELFLARHAGIEGFEKLVVLKRILPELSGDAEFVRMFLDEARLAAGLHHSNVVQVYDIGEAADGFYFAMEYLHGEDLRQLMRTVESAGERVPLEHALSIVLGVCAGLHYAHERAGSDGKPLGIVHRDVSPHNVFVTWDGGVKVLDFGIAKAARRLSETRTGALKGKIQYMSPEQCQADPVDRRSDVFAIAILLWELTVGRRLFSGRSDLAIMKAIVEEDAPLPSDFVTGYPPELERIVMKGLKRRAQDRYPTAEAMQLAIEELARSRRLALSPVGLSRFIKQRFGGDAEAWAEAQRGGVEAMTSYAVSRLERRPSDEQEDDKSGPHTRALAAEPPPKRGRRPLLIAVAAAGLLAAAGVGVGLTRRHVPPPPPVVVVPVTPPVVVEPKDVEPPPPPPPPAPVATPTERKPKHVVRPHPRAHRRAVDLDAPLPPK